MKNTWLLAQATMRQARVELLDILGNVPGFHWPSHKMTKQEIVDEIIAARRAHWDNNHKQPAASSEPRRMRGAITAAECNAFLHTLPPPEPI